MHSINVKLTSETYVPDMDSDKINLEATLEDTQIDAFQDEMAVARKRLATGDDTQDDDLLDADKDKNQPPQLVEAKVFINKSPTTKQSKRK